MRFSELFEWILIGISSFLIFLTWSVIKDPEGSSLASKLGLMIFKLLGLIH